MIRHLADAIDDAHIAIGQGKNQTTALVDVGLAAGMVIGTLQARIQVLEQKIKALEVAAHFNQKENNHD